MIVCAIQINHQPSVCVIRNDKVIWYKEERKLSGERHIKRAPYGCIDLLFKTKKFQVDKFVITGYNYVEIEVGQVLQYLRYKNILLNNENGWSFHAFHHAAHAFKSYIDSGFKKARVFVVDGRGSDWYLTDKTETYETTSIYDFDENSVKCIYKKVWSKFKKDNNVTVDINYHPSLNKNWINEYKPLLVNNQTKFEITNTLDLGYFYGEVSALFNFSDEEGKFMGYQSYGSFDKDVWNTIKEGVTEEQLKKLPKNKNTAATCQIYFEKKYEELVEKFKSDNMVFTGGTALNIINNYKLQKKFSDCNLWFDPLCGDEGTSIGGAYAYLYFNKQKIKPLDNVYLGGEIKKIDIKLHDGEKIIENVETDKVVDLLNQGHVVGLIQGKSEGGPRALGNRSLLLDPTLNDAKIKMNTIKNREPFRPFACSILEEKAGDYFEMLNIKQTPFMMHAPQAKKLAKETIPSLVHVDGSCRIQTVNEKQNKVLYEILKKFKVPVIMNTSFNLSGFSIVENLQQVLYSFRNSNLKYVYFADLKVLLLKG